MGASVDTITNPFEWGPIVLLAIGLIATAVGFFFKSILSSLSKLTNSLATISTTIAVMQEHTRNSDEDIATTTKYHDEIIEHKQALAVLNVNVARLMAAEVESTTGNRRRIVEP